MAGKCISNSAYMSAAQRQATAIKNQAHAEAALNIALALWQRNSSRSVASMQEAIAKRNIKLAREAFEHAKKFWPCQKAIVDLAFGESKASIQSSGLAAQFRGFGDKTLGEGRDQWYWEAKRHCIEITPCDEARWDRFVAATQADLISFGDRQAEARAQTLNDRRHDRMYSTLAMGKGIIRNVGSYSDISGAAGMSAAQLLGGAINSGLEAIGYHMNRERPTRWDGAADTPHMPHKNPSKPEGYTVVVGTAKDEPIEVGCPEPSDEDRRLRTSAYIEYLKCMGRVK